ncbi:MAG: hypothetical protein K5697_10970 [Lachnospiraceae bacterium]|nr:hypothetical protein [Lachnospiraceae bacterium]
MTCKYRTIYAVCAKYVKTGGTEVVHQLVWWLNQLGANARIAYFNKGGMESYPMCHPEFLHYVDGVWVDINEIEDAADIAIVVPESCPEFLAVYEKASLYLWWLSVDFFPRDYYSPAEVSEMFEFMRLRGVRHLVQSAYAEHYILEMGIDEGDIRHLADYINQSFLDEKEDNGDVREDIILYNPMKGKEYVETLIKAAPDLCFVPIMRMTTEQVAERMRHAKLYIDFGNHPGKDRIPREAAMCGCCVITGRRGSAAFSEDVSIPEKYRIEENETGIPEVLSVIRNCLENYETEKTLFQDYREKIRSEKEEFKQDIKEAFFN